MPGFLGSDTEALRREAASLDAGRERLVTHLDTMRALVHREDIWRGPDADSFRHTFDMSVARVLTQVCGQLGSRADLLDQQAQAQDETSAADGSLGAAASPFAAYLPGIPPSGPLTRPENPTRAGRESGRRGEGGDEPSEGDLGPGLPGGLGDPVPGTSAPDPGMSAWHPVDEGAGEWGSEDPELDDYAGHEGATTLANAMSEKWPDASENLLHFLGNSGEDKEMDIEAYLEDEPGIAARIDEHEQEVADAALEQAQQSGATGPVTFPVQTDWPGVRADTRNWFYATGSGNYSLNGQVTVYPPDASNPEWRYEMDTELHYRDQCNWDGSKSTKIDHPGPYDPEVTDEQLAELHRAGLAQEFLLYGDQERHRTGP